MISFENGQPFPGEYQRMGRPVKHTSAMARKAVVATSKVIQGEALLVPNASEFIKELGCSVGSLYSKGMRSYSGYLEHATGLKFVEHNGPLLIPEGTSITALADSPTPPKEPEVSSERIVEITDRINELAVGLPPEVKAQIGRLLIQER